MKLDIAKFQQPSTTQETTAASPAAASPTALSGKLQLESKPTGADIEIDGNFVGDTPSDVEVADGEHAVTVKKAGYKDWERKLKVSAGSSVHINAELEKIATQ